MIKKGFTKKMLAVVLGASLLAGSIPGMVVPVHAEEEESLPSKLDLRDRGVVTPVKDQSPFGTCWGFSAIAAVETSLLTTLGMTCEEFEQKYGFPMDLSEHHLTWFTDAPISATSLEQTQTGEGWYFVESVADGGMENDKSALRLDGGGMMFQAANVFASIIGPIYEQMAPYHNAENTAYYLMANGKYGVFYPQDAPVDAIPVQWDPRGDWSLPEEDRFMAIALLKDSKLLTSPAWYDEEGHYHYNEQGTKEIKQELLAGRAVSIGFCADVSRPGDFDKETAYINLDTYAHYTYESVAANHGVTIVGYDDNYSRDNFNAAHKPPADGAWIVKNSWGAADQLFPNHYNWGVNGSGYFYLSYYDQTLVVPETFEFDLAEKGVDYLVSQYDYLPEEEMYTLTSANEVAMSNVFTTEYMEKLESVTIKTEAATATTVDIYQLNKGATQPTDGKLLYHTQRQYDSAGIHRVTLDKKVVLPKNTKYSVVVTNQTPVVAKDGSVQNYYAVSTAWGINAEGVIALTEEYGELAKDRYALTVVNKGESFLYKDGAWTDWTDYLETNYNSVVDNDLDGDFIDEEVEMRYFDFDNFPIKVYSSIVK